MRRCVMAAVLAGALTACSGSTPISEGPRATEREVSDPRPAPAPAYDPREDPETLEYVFLTVLREQNPRETLGVSDRDLVDLGRSVCSLMDESDGSYTVAFLAMVAAADDNGLSTRFAGSLVGVATPAFCPEHQRGVDEFIETWGE